MTLSFFRVRALFRYDDCRGVLIRRVQCGGQLPGAIAGSANQEGRIQIKIDGKSYCRSKLVWLYKTGGYPKHDVDHRDLDNSNDRWRNLRKATRKQNCHNAEVRINNKLGLKGVHQVRGRFRAMVAGEHIGYFSTASLAKKAVNKRAKEVAGEFFRP
jgi:hypothetical protein